MTPLLSVLMPTYERPGLLARAIRIFDAYRYPEKELIVVDDSRVPYAGHIGKRINYVHLPARAVLGRKHNLAASLAQGEIFVHRDDDDLFSPLSLSRQADAIAVDGADTNPTTAPAFTFHDSNSAYHRRVWASGIQYTMTPVAQKVHFLNDAIRAGFKWKALENRDQFVYSRHDIGGGNTWKFSRGNMVEVAAPNFSTYGWLAQLLGRAA